MSETNDRGEAQKVPPQFELEQVDQYSQYMLHTRVEILDVLRSLIKKGALITAHFDHGKSFLLTSMLALVDDNRAMIFDIGSNAEMNHRALVAGTVFFTSLVDKVKVQFSVRKLSATQYEGGDAFLAEVPDALLRLQRREYFRLTTPVANPITLSATIKRPDGSSRAVQIALSDVSGGGIGLMATPDLAGFFQQGDTLVDCRIGIPDEGILITKLVVRNIFDVTTRGGAHFVRIGCEYVDLPPQRLTMVQRYITRIERERKARMSGMA
jgi:c-di-GMP-binding flagellar brake protein YcgR